MLQVSSNQFLFFGPYPKLGNLDGSNLLDETWTLFDPGISNPNACKD